MGFFNIGRIVGAFFNQLFRWLFWNKTGQKILFTIVIAIILVVFFKLGEVAAVEPDNFSTYEQISFDGTLSDTRITNTGYLDSRSGDIVYYIELNPYNYYVVTNNTSNRSFRYGFSNSLNINQQLSNSGEISMNGTGADYEFSGSGYKYFLCMVTATNSIFPDIYYNAFPYEVNGLIYNGVSTTTNSVELAGSDTAFHTKVFPIYKGGSYRLFTDSSSNLKVGFTTDSGFMKFIDKELSETLSSYNTYKISSLGTLNSSESFDFVMDFDGFLLVSCNTPGTTPGAIPDIKLFNSFNSGQSYDSFVTNNNINSTTSSVNNLNDSITDSSISDNNDDYVLPESGVNDIAESGFANIFDKLRLAFTSESSGQGMVVNFPFTDKSFTISRSTVYGSAQLGIVGTLINSFWYFIVSLWIVKDIAHKMNMIKSGNIELAQTSNIKEDLL